MSTPTETLTDKALSIDLTETDQEIRLRWRGKSTEREPGQFLMPILLRALERGHSGKKQVILDFSEMEYMNSSTFSPLVKILGEAAKGAHRVLVEYSQGRKWQSLSFSALKAFETTDSRIALRGK
jgi:hypothetical protein